MLKKYNSVFFIKSMIISSLLSGIVMANTLNVDKTSKIVPNNIFSLMKKSLIKKKDKQKNLPQYREGEVIVKYKSGVNNIDIKHFSYTKNFNVVRIFTKFSKDNPIAILKSTKTTQDMIKKLKSDSNVESVSPNYIRYISATPNDPDFSKLWGLENTGQTGGTSGADINATGAWDKNRGSSDVVVAIFDTGIDYNHNDLKDNLWINNDEIANNGIDDDDDGFIDDIYGADVAADLNYTNNHNDGDPMDVNGHGTHVAGTIGAKGDDDFGISGVNWNVKIMAVKIFASVMSGAAESDIMEAIDYVLKMKEKGVNIVAINASYGGGCGSDFQNDPMNDAIKSLGSKGIIFVAAAGNEATNNDKTPSCPSSYDASNIIAVASTDHNDNLSSFSNYGEKSVDIAAPGSLIYSTMKFKMDYTPEEDASYFNDASNDDDWSQGGEDANWSLTEDNAESGQDTLTDSKDGNYSNNSFTYIMPSDPIDLTDMKDKDLTFGFDAVLDLENGYDYLEVLFSPDNGDNWALMATYSGEDIDRQAYSIEIQDLFQTDKFLYAFAVVTDDSVTRDGVYIDDIAIDKGTRTNDRYATMSGTSMATPHVTGSVALMASAFSKESVQERKNRILNGVDKLDSLKNAVLTGGRLNIAKSINISTASNEENTQKESSGGGCTYNPNNKSIDFMFIVMLLVSLFYPIRHKYIK